MRTIILRVAARHQAREFSTPEALKDYLHDHPQADPKNHSVVKHEEHGHKEDEHGGEAKPKKTWKEMVQNLSGKAKDFLKKAPSEVKKFVEDEEHRAASLIKAHKAILDAPAKYVKSAYQVAKHEVHEFKEAGEGIHAWMSGKEVSKEQKKAIRKVAVHVAVTAAAGTLGVGIGAGAAAISKGILGSFITSTAKKIALKAVTRHLEHLPSFEEVGHIAHHGAELVSEIMEKLAAEEKEADPDEVFQALIAAIVAKGLKELDPDTVQEALDDAAGV